MKKKEKRKRKKLKKKLKKEKKSRIEAEQQQQLLQTAEKLKEKKSKKRKTEIECGPVVPELSRSLAPMTKEEWEKRQSVVRRVLDEDTGRMRLIKGDGEVIEECVSRSQQKEINRQATLGDGASFQSALSSKVTQN